MIERRFNRESEPTLDYKDTGKDLALDPSNNYDIQINPSGDINTVEGTHSIVTSLIRRALTPTGGYARWVLNPSGWKAVGVGFGNNSAFFVSQSDPNLSSLEDSIRSALEKDGRVDIIEVSAYSTQPDTVEVTLQYQIKGEATVRQESLTLE
jgi:hypothetical protein